MLLNIDKQSGNQKGYKNLFFAIVRGTVVATARSAESVLMEEATLILGECEA